MTKIITHESKKDNRTRNWSCVVYPDSAPADWREILDEEHVEWVESPLHDRDVNPDKTIKKPHWHILLMFDGVKRFEQVREITERLNAPIPQKVNSAKGLVRYMIHLDDPNKAQYPVSGIIAHGGADLADMLKPTASSRYEMIAEMVRYIAKNRISEFMDFMLYCQAEHFDDWFPLLCDSSAFVIDKAIKSNRHKTPVSNLSAADLAKKAIE